MVDEPINTGNILDMNSINTTCNNLLVKGNQRTLNALKTLLEENVKNIVFNQPSARNQPERPHPTLVQLQLITLLTHKTISTPSFKLPS